MRGIDSYLVRVVIMLDLLPCRPGQKGRTVSELVNELASRGIAIGHRTVQRDLETWSEIFDLQCDRRSESHYWKRTRKGHLSDHFLIEEYFGDPVDPPEGSPSPRYGCSSRHPAWPHEPETWMNDDRGES